MKKIILIILLLCNFSLWAQEEAAAPSADTGTSTSNSGGSPSIIGLGLGDDYFFFQYESVWSPSFSGIINHTYFMESNMESDNADNFLWNVTGVGGRFYFNGVFRDGFNLAGFVKLARNGKGLDDNKQNFMVLSALPAYAWFWGSFGINLGMEFIMSGPKKDLKYEDGDKDTETYTSEREAIHQGQMALHLSVMIGF